MPPAVDVDMERVPENGSDCGTRDSISDSENVVKKKKIKKKGIIYLSTIPPYMNVAKIREIFGQYGDVGRIYLQPSASTYFEVKLLWCYNLVSKNNYFNDYLLFQSQERSVSVSLTSLQKVG